MHHVHVAVKRTFLYVKAPHGHIQGPPEWLLIWTSLFASDLVARLTGV
jgi:hypothetical protein